jgi:hypothetical protein
VRPQRKSGAALGIVAHLRRRFSRFKLGTHFLDLRCHSEDGYKIMLDEQFDVIGYSITK